MWFRGDDVRKNKMLVTLGVKIDEKNGKSLLDQSQSIKKQNQFSPSVHQPWIEKHSNFHFLMNIPIKEGLFIFHYPALSNQLFLVAFLLLPHFVYFL